MDKQNRNAFDLFGILKSWIPKPSKSHNVSRDFWMPDNSCRVCYECDTQFTLFNRKHHCRICGRIFCAKCTTNSIPLCSVDTNNAWEEWEKVRVCNYCFKQWEQGLARVGNGPHDDPAHLPLATSINGSKPIGTAYDSAITICAMSFGLCDHFSDNFSLYQSDCQSAVMDPYANVHGLEGSERLNISDPGMEDSSINQFVSDANRSNDDNDDAYGLYQLDSNASSAPQADDYYGPVEFDRIQSAYQSQNFVPDMDSGDTKSLSSSAFQDNYDMQDANELQQLGRNDLGEECEAPSSLCAAEDVNIELVDFENNGLLWLPPDPENEEDDREAGLFDEDDDDEVAVGEWGQLRSSGSFGSGQDRRGDKCGEEHKKAMKNIVDGHFRALISQLLQVENIPVSDDDFEESWLEIITALSWEAATLLKPDTSKGGGMDPAGYVKVKCLASGRRSHSTVIKGVVCKKNVAHRRMTTRIEKPRVMILGGALEYQRVSNHLSSFDTLLQQEMDHLKMAVAKIDAHRPNVLLVERSVSRCAQEYILAKDISLVLNIKRPLLERIARCTGAQIVPSIDHLSAKKMGHCELFHVDKCFENHGSAGQSGKKLTKTLMYFENCPKPLGCTILLRGANGNELKKVKHVVQYGIFAAYHLALETSFLADERAAFPEVPLTVALPNKTFGIDRSISMVPGFFPALERQQNFGDPNSLNSVYDNIPSDYPPLQDTELIKSMSLPAIPVSPDVGSSVSDSSIGNPLASDLVSEVGYDKVCSTGTAERETLLEEPMNQGASATNTCETYLDNHPKADGCGPTHAREYEFVSEDVCNVKHMTNAESISWQQDAKTIQDEVGPPKEEFPPSPSDEQSILVSLSSRCVWKGTVCERSHLFRIKYYGSFDKPLGRFLQDNLFDQNYKCRSCEMPSEAHVHCYTHRQGTLTISVKKLQLILPGELDGKIWMWHRCLHCPRTDGFPPATLRVLMSDAAWGLSFGKFLELSFSNHAAASRVASCGHSLHRDCLRFYGCGRMVACFHYASIDVFSVFLPPPKLEFNYDVQDWIQTEANEVVDRAEFLFSEVLNGICQIAEKRYGGGAPDSGVISRESRNHIAELKGVLQNERTEFEEMHQKIVNAEGKMGHPAIDILEINRLRRQLLFQSYMWDHHLVYAACLDDDSYPAGCIPNSEEKTAVTSDFTAPNIITRPSNVVTSGESQVGPNLSRSYDLVAKTENAMKPQEMAHQIKAVSPNLSCTKEDPAHLSVCTKVFEGPAPLECGLSVRRTLSDTEFVNLSDTLDARWIGKSQSGAGVLVGSVSVDSSLAAVAEKLAQENPVEERNVVKTTPSLPPSLPPSPSPAPAAISKSSDSAEDTKGWLGMPFINFYRSLNKNFLENSPKLDTFGGYNPMYVSSVWELGLQGGAKWLLPVGFNETVIPVYDDEPTSIISYALISQDYCSQLSEEAERAKELLEASFSLPLQESASFHPFLSLDESMMESCRSLSIDESFLSTSAPRNFSSTDPLLRTKSSHIRVSFTDNGPLDKVKYTVTCYYAKHFDALRKMCCPELDYVRSLSRCKKWGAQGGKSNVFFAKTLDDRFIIKQVTKTELESFIKFGPEYFKYLTESISSKSPTCLAKILGIYQVATKNLKGGKELKMDVLVMENLLFKRNVTRLYDLKGSSRSRYNPDTSGSNKVLLDQNLIEAMPTSPIFVGNKAKRLLERAVWNDTSLLASIDVMDYSLLVGVDEDKHELVVGIIDFMRQYTWDKHLETWVKASGIFGGPKNVSPTIISPEQYKKRFRKAMTTYFLMVPDQWSPPTIIPSRSQSNLNEEHAQLGTTVNEVCKLQYN